MSPDEFAALELRLGAKLIKVGGIWWRRVRPFFYRPLLVHEPLDEAVVRRPVAWPATYQFAVINTAAANSTLNFLVYENLPDYSLECVNIHRRKQIKRAASEFRVAPISDLAQFKQEGYRVYLSFYERTHYEYKAERRNKVAFERWAETLFRYPKVILLGAFGPTGLAAVSVLYLVNQTLIYATHMSETVAMKKNIGSLLLHEIRMRAAAQDEITRILVRPYRGGNSLDRFYLERDCSLLRIPARLGLWSPLGLFLRLVVPRCYALLTGRL